MFHYDYVHDGCIAIQPKTMAAFKSLRECKIITNVHVTVLPDGSAFRLTFDTFYNEGDFFTLLSGMIA